MAGLSLPLALPPLQPPPNLAFPPTKQRIQRQLNDITHSMPTSQQKRHHLHQVRKGSRREGRKAPDGGEVPCVQLCGSGRAARQGLSAQPPPASPPPAPTQSCSLQQGSSTQSSPGNASVKRRSSNVWDWLSELSGPAAEQRACGEASSKRDPLQDSPSITNTSKDPPATPTTICDSSK